MGRLSTLYLKTRTIQDHIKVKGALRNQFSLVTNDTKLLEALQYI